MEPGRSGSSRPTPKAGPRRRGASLEEALLDAAWSELLAVGYRDLTMEGIARRAGTSKPVIYRRWPNRVEVVMAALRRRSSSLEDRTPDTGSLRDDALAVLRHMNRRFSDVPAHARRGLITGVFAEGSLLPKNPAGGVMPRIMNVILRRAAARGEISLARVPERIARLPADLVRQEMMLFDAPVPEKVLVEIVDDIFLPLVGRRTTVGARSRRGHRTERVRG